MDRWVITTLLMPPFSGRDVAPGVAVDDREDVWDDASKSHIIQVTGLSKGLVGHLE